MWKGSRILEVDTLIKQKIFNKQNQFSRINHARFYQKILTEPNYKA